ncbi:Ribosomal protein L27/L41 mitochondrial, partial [Trinorchestia longiramus]
MKPYVSYRVPDIEEPEFTPQDLFHAVYTDKIVQDFKAGKLKQDLSPEEPSPEEQLTREQAKIKAQQTGSD